MTDSSSGLRRAVQQSYAIDRFVERQMPDGHRYLSQQEAVVDRQLRDTLRRVGYREVILQAIDLVEATIGAEPHLEAARGMVKTTMSDEVLAKCAEDVGRPVDDLGMGADDVVPSVMARVNRWFPGPTPEAEPSCP